MKNKKSQLDKFKEAARELGCGESEWGFDEKLKWIGKPQDEPIKHD